MREQWTIRDLFEAGLPGFLARHKLPSFLRRAAQALRQCRTAALGGHVEACPRGHVHRVHYNSCGHRSCPQCAFRKIDDWLKSTRARILPCDHFHFTFTLPSELHVLWRYNYAALAHLLFRAARDTLFLLLDDPRWLGARPGVLMALHTWSRSLTLHPHVHCLVSAGGLASDGSWKEPSRRHHLLSLDVVRPIFKAKLRDGLRRLLRRGELALPPDMNENDAEWAIERAMRKKWIIDRRERYAHGRGVVNYLARYVRGGPIKNRRIVAFDGERVTFRKSRRGEPHSDMTLSLEELLGRILQHVPPPGFKTVRSFGLYAPSMKEKRERCRARLGGGSGDGDHREESAAAGGEEEEPRAKSVCPVCGLALVLVEKLEPARGPPPERRSALRRAA